MDQRKEASQNDNENEITEAISLLAGQAQRTLSQELRKAQSSPNPPFFLKLKPPKNGESDEEFKKDRTELQNFAEVLAETIAQLLKQAKQTLLTRLKKTQGNDGKNEKVNDPKKREDEVRNFTKIFAETRAKLVDDVKGLVKELRKDQGDEDSSTKRPASLFSILGVDDVLLGINPQIGTKRTQSKSSNYDPRRDSSKKPLTSPIKTKAAMKQLPVSVDDEECFICGEIGHWAYQCSKPDNRKCYICNETGHISSKCSKPDNRLCYVCNKDGHFKSECIKNLKRKREGRSRSSSSERSNSREKSYSRERSYSRSRKSSCNGSRR